MTELAKGLYALVDEKNVVATIFACKALGEWVDQPSRFQHEHSGEVNVKMTHLFVAPEMLEGPEFQAMVERQRSKAKAVSLLETADDAEEVD